MAKNLVIVESPAKAKTIEGFLGKEYTVKSSYGHVRDLNKNTLSVDIENDFEGSSINADQKDANKGLFAGMEKNVDEPGATTQNDTTLPFENVTVKSFADIEDDAKACMIK